MTFSKNFPRTVPGSNYPKWEEVYLDAQEEQDCDRQARDENLALMKECINDAKQISQEKELKEYQTDVISIAIALFEKRASHAVYHKEAKAKEKFDEIYSTQ